MRQVPGAAGPTKVVCRERSGRSRGTSRRMVSLPAAATSPPNVARPCSQSSPTVIVKSAPSVAIELSTSEKFMRFLSSQRTSELTGASEQSRLTRSRSQPMALAASKPRQAADSSAGEPTSRQVRARSCLLAVRACLPTRSACLPVAYCEREAGARLADFLIRAASLRSARAAPASPARRAPLHRGSL